MEIELMATNGLQQLVLVLPIYSLDCQLTEGGRLRVFLLAVSENVRFPEAG